MNPLEWPRVLTALALAIVTLGAPSWIVVGGAQREAQTLAKPANGAAPATLEETGLYADFASKRVAESAVEFAPQYPLWTDGALKRRWIRLPPKTFVDASDPDAWSFPVGAKLWKEFAFERRVETRYMELGADGRWIYATYVWSEDGSQAKLAPERGQPGACESVDGARHDIPSRYDCLACHEGGATPVLGFSALQLSDDRDARALHAPENSSSLVKLRELVDRGLVRNLPAEHVENAPRIAATSPVERAALGYLHGNCASCHNARGPLAELGLDLEFSLVRGSSAARTTVGAEARFRLPGVNHASPRIAPGAPESSVLFARVSSRNPLVQMPALGTHVVDAQAVELLREWIAVDLSRSRVASNGGAPSSRP